MLSSFTLEFPLPHLSAVSLSNFICNLKKAQGFQARIHMFFHFFNRFHEMTKKQNKTNIQNSRKNKTEKSINKNNDKEVSQEAGILEYLL